MSCTSSNR
jgi:hypothetical protein